MENQPTNSYGSLLVSIIFNRIPEELQIIISRHFKGSDWDLKEIINLFKDELQARERCAAIAHKSDINNTSALEEPYSAQTFLTRNLQADSYACVFCMKNHSPTSCPIVTDVSRRFNILKESRRCYVCLKKGHVASKCFSKIVCIKCGRKHNVSTCNEVNPNPNQTTIGERNQSQYFGQQSVHNLSAHISFPLRNIILQTAKAEITNPVIHVYTMSQIIFDACSQRSYITEHLRNMLKLRTRRKEKIIIKKFASKEDTVQSLDVVLINIKGKSCQSVNIEALVIPFICAQLENPPLQAIQRNCEHLKKLPLAENVGNNTKLEIDVLVGLDYYYSIMTGKIIRGTPSQPIAAESILGWIICGPNRQTGLINKRGTETVLTSIINTEPVTNVVDTLRGELQKFWKIGVEDDYDVYEVFKNEVKYVGNRYVTSLPFKPYHDTLSDNYQLSLCRLFSLKKKLDGDENLKKEYDAIFRMYEKEGIIKRVNKAKDLGNPPASAGCEK